MERYNAENLDMKAIIAEIEAGDDGMRYPVNAVIGTSTPGSRFRGLRMREGITQKELGEKSHHWCEKLVEAKFFTSSTDSPYWKPPIGE